MSTQTPNLGLIKPDYNDTVDVDDLNHNMDIIDAAIFSRVYPVGAIYLSVVNTNPASLFGGTWEQLKDRFLIGAGGSYTNGATGGAVSVSYTPAGTNSGGAVANHTLTLAQIPSHNHSFTGTAVTSGGISANHTHSGTTGGRSARHRHTGPSHNHYVGAWLWANASSGGRQIAKGSDYAHITSVAHTDAGGTGNTGTDDTDHTHSMTTGTVSAGHTHSVTAAGSIGNSGNGGAHNHGFTNPTFSGTTATIATMPPYLAVYMWKRTA